MKTTICRYISNNKGLCDCGGVVEKLGDESGGLFWLGLRGCMMHPAIHASERITGEPSA